MKTVIRKMDLDWQPLVLVPALALLTLPLIGSGSHNCWNARSRTLSYPPPDNSPEARFFKWFAQSMKWFVIEELRLSAIPVENGVP